MLCREKVGLVPASVLSRLVAASDFEQIILDETAEALHLDFFIIAIILSVGWPQESVWMNIEIIEAFRYT